MFLFARRRRSHHELKILKNLLPFAAFFSPNDSFHFDGMGPFIRSVLNKPINSRLIIERGVKLVESKCELMTATTTANGGDRI